MKNFNDVIAPKDRARLERSIASLDKRLTVLWKKQCERFEANRLAEEKRNYELTKKYNLLEFV